MGRKWHIGVTVLAAIIATAICVLVGWYEVSYIHDHAPPPPSPPYVPARLPTAVSLFMESNAVDGISIADCAGMDLTGTGHHVQYKYFYRTSYDFRTNALFLTYYIPRHALFVHGDNMLKMITFIASQADSQVAEGREYFTSAFAGNSNIMSSSEFKFTGRVYLYIDDLMEMTTKEKLKQAFSDKGMFLDVEGPEQAQALQAAMIAAREPSLPEYRLSYNQIEIVPNSGTHGKLSGIQKTIWRSSVDPSGEQCILSP